MAELVETTPYQAWDNDPNTLDLDCQSGHATITVVTPDSGDRFICLDCGIDIEFESRILDWGK